MKTYRILGTSARIDVEDPRFDLIQPGRCIPVEMLHGALQELWGGGALPSEGGKKFEIYYGMSGRYTARSYIQEWRKIDEYSIRVLPVRRPLARLQVSMYGKTNHGAGGDIGQMLLLMNHYDIPRAPVSLVEEEEYELERRVEATEWQGVRVVLESEYAPDESVWSQKVIRFEEAGICEQVMENEEIRYYIVDPKILSHLVEIGIPVDPIKRGDVRDQPHGILAILQVEEGSRLVLAPLVEEA